MNRAVGVALAMILGLCAIVGHQQARLAELEARAQRIENAAEGAALLELLTTGAQVAELEARAQRIENAAEGVALLDVLLEPRR